MLYLTIQFTARVGLLKGCVHWAHPQSPVPHGQTALKLSLSLPHQHLFLQNYNHNNRSTFHFNEKWKWKSHSLSDSLQPHGLYSPWNSPGQNTGVGSHSLLQGTFPTQESNQGLWRCRWILYQLSYQGSNERSQRICIKVLTTVSAWRGCLFLSLLSWMWMIMMWTRIYLVIKK